MAIYILDQDPEETAKFLDNKSLKFMIKDIAQVLCNAHWLIQMGKQQTSDCPLPLTVTNKKHYKEMWGLPTDFSRATIKWYEWTQWARECVANYEYLWKLGFACDWELAHRNDFKLSKKYHDILEWCRDNVPDFSNYKYDGAEWEPEAAPLTPFPLVMPKKYSEYYKGWEPPRTIAAYRNYYQEKLRQINLKELYKKDMTEITYKYPIKWTSREIPEWLNL